MNFLIIAVIFLPFSCAYYIQNGKENLFELFEQIQDLDNLSETCKTHLSASLQNGALVNMLDAGAKVPDGIKNGRYFHLGDYDECLDTTYFIVENGLNSTHYAKYCLSTVPFSKLFPSPNPENKPNPRMLGIDTASAGLHLAVCLPSGCTPEEFSQYFTLFGDKQIFYPSYCYQKDKPKELSGGAIATIVVLSIFVAITFASTVYDCCLYYTGKKTPSPLLTAFSILSNGRKLFTFSSNPDQLTSLNGIRAISMMWVILGHQYSDAAYMSPSANMNSLNSWANQFGSMYIIGATVSVDTFFMAGGLVTVYTFLKSQEHSKKFNIFLFYLHRYLRLTPALGIVILIYANLLNYLGDGPMWGSVDAVLQELCRKNWWHNLLYIQNYVGNMEDMCVAQSWYLSVDMQLFLLSPLILLPLVYYPTLTFYALEALTGIGIIIPFALTWVFKLPALMFTTDVADNTMVDYQNKYYIQTYARFAPYTIGMIFGYLIYHQKKSSKPLKIKFHINILLWAFSILGMIVCVYSGHWLMNVEKSLWSNSFFTALSRPGWSFCVALCVFACVTGNGGPVNTFLSLPIFQFLTKISYSMYLTHFAVVVMTYYSQRLPVYFSNYQMMTTFWGTFMFTVCLSMVLSLIFESPIIIIEKLIFGTDKKKKQNNIGNS